jgi:hypothetical protein
MELRAALQLIWDDVADRVLRNPSLAAAVREVRHNTDEATLNLILQDQREGAFEDVGDLHGAYVEVQSANQEDLNIVVNALVREYGQLG